MSITLTPAAAERVRSFISKEGGVALRVAVKQTGCSGWAYVVSLANSIEPDDRVFDDAGVKVVVDQASLPYLDGSSIDFRAEGINHTFHFENPNATDECGCGESFTIQ
jgi:iron-sulfur cluster assembly protein